MTIWAHHGGQALGDSWNLVSWLLQQPPPMVLLSTDFPLRDRDPADMHFFVRQIACHMHSPTTIGIVNMPGEPIPQRGAGALWDPERPCYTPTHQRWSRRGRQAGKVCYQFDARSAKHANNCPTDTEVQDLMRRFPGWQWVPLGLPLSLGAIINQLATCTAFVGADSGVSHIAHSVGCPMAVWSTTDHAWTRSMHPRDGWLHAQSGTAVTAFLDSHL